MMVMLLVTALASFVVLVTRVAADPSDHPDSHHRRYHSGLTVPFTKKNLGQYNPVQSDQRRFTNLMKKANTSIPSNLARDTAEPNMTNTGSSYVAEIGVGVPPTYCTYCLYFPSACSLLYGPF
jgi:hypothetical protein